MDPVPSLGLELGISPYSSSDTGSNMTSFAPNFSRRAVSFGGGAGETPISGLIRDGALVLVLVFGARWLWGKF